MSFFYIWIFLKRIPDPSRIDRGISSFPAGCRRWSYGAAVRKTACGLCGLILKSAAILLVLILMCGCGRSASEPVLEPVPTAGGSFDFSRGDENRGEESVGSVRVGEKREESFSGPVLNGKNLEEKSAGSAEDAEKRNENSTGSVSEDGNLEKGEEKFPTGSAKAGAAGAAAESESGNSESGEEIPEENGASGELTVHVCGAVKKEGVYSLPEGSRISDAVEAAGGFDVKADTSFLNLAMKLEDSWQIRVPTVEEAKTLREKTGGAYDADSSFFTGVERSAVVSGTGTVVSGGSAGVTGAFVSGGSAGGTGTEARNPEKGSGSPDGGQKININTASEEELTGIPGVGESKAKRIVEYREQNGRFESIEDIMKVTGIKENSFRKMRDYITV